MIRRVYVLSEEDLGELEIKALSALHGDCELRIEKPLYGNGWLREFIRQRPQDFVYAAQAPGAEFVSAALSGCNFGTFYYLDGTLQAVYHRTVIGAQEVWRNPDWKRFD